MGGPSGINALDTRVAVVTGAARNIGRASAIALADAGARVLVTDRDADGLADTVERIAAAHGAETVASTVADLLDPSAPASVIHHAATRFGALDVIVHCAAGRGGGRLDEFTVERWDDLHAVNVRAGAFLVQAALPHLDTSAHAAVVLLSSVHGTATAQTRVAYAASKGAVDALVRGLAVELGPRGIRVNGIRPAHVPAEGGVAPGPVELAAYPLGRLGTPEDIANAVVFLASDSSSWMTGALVDVDGGKRAILADAAALGAYRMLYRAPAWRTRIKRFGGRIRR